MGLLPALWLCGILQMVSTLMFSIQAMVGHSLWVLCASISIENLSGGMGTAAFVAYLSYLCNREYTATQYALLSSIMIAAGKLLIATVFAVDQSYFPDGSFIDVIGWSWFFVIATVCAVPGLLLLSVLASREKRIGGKKGKRNSPLPNEAIAESGAEG
jgi:PAT family beta-lactamase induction signal transducer AmpG